MKGNRTTAATGRRKTVPPKTDLARIAATHAKKSPERQALVLKGLELGMSFEAAARLAGLTKTTVKAWRDADPAFNEQCGRAKAELEARMLGRIELAAKDPRTWGAAAWKLERMFPDRYGRSTRMEVTGKGGGPLQHAVVDMRSLSNEELRAIAAGEVTTYDADDEDEDE